jgi:hypothetical protein
VGALEVRVGTWKPPKGWTGSPKLAEVASFDLKAKGDGVRLRLRFSPAVDASVALASAVRILRPTLSMNHYPSVAVGNSPSARMAALVGCINAAPGRDADLVIEQADWDVDPTIHRPVGRRSDVPARVIPLPALGAELTVVDVAALRTTS